VPHVDDDIKREDGPPMSVDRPFYRTVRQFADGLYTQGGRGRYVSHPSFASHPSDFVRAFSVIQKDLISIFEFIEPDEQNRDAYSLRTYELLLRACTEIETNFKAIFAANTYTAPNNLTMHDYAKIEQSHYLSQFEVKVHYWKGNGGVRRPFAGWAGGGHTLAWYQDYNNAKHDRVENMNLATLGNVVDAVAGLVVVLSSQFLGEDFGPGPGYLITEGIGDGYEGAIGNYFRLRFPQHVPEPDRYAFDWSELRQEIDPFQRFDYDAI
jgi:hypothetical protein